MSETTTLAAELSSEQTMMDERLKSMTMSQRLTLLSQLNKRLRVLCDEVDFVAQYIKFPHKTPFLVSPPE